MSLSDSVFGRSPEERELEKKRAELAALEATLAGQELDLATLKSELDAFERLYLRIIGVRLAKLDEIEAQIAELLVGFEPGNKAAQKYAERSRYRAKESAKATEGVNEIPRSRDRFHPSENLKRLYREVAKQVHPDLATDDEDRTVRTEMMVRANKAYSEGDEDALQSILEEWKGHPSAIQGEGIGVELVRTIRKIAQVEERLKALTVEIAKIGSLDLHLLKVKVEDGEKHGRDLLQEMATRLDAQIANANDRLSDIRMTQKGKAR